jgi:hypothetical protein
MSNPLGNWIDLSAVSNLYIQTYVKGFVDMSGGNLILRNNNIYVNSGDLSLGGRLLTIGDASLGGNLYVKNKLTVNGDISANGNVAIYGNLMVQQLQNTNIINTSVNNYQLVVTEDISLNGRLLVRNDASFGGNLIMIGSGTTGRLGIGTTSPAYTLDVSGTINTNNMMINSFPVILRLYGAVTYYSSTASTPVSSGATPTANVPNFFTVPTVDTSMTKNWPYATGSTATFGTGTTTYNSKYMLNIPYTGIYTISIHHATNLDSEITVVKNPVFSTSYQLYPSDNTLLGISNGSTENSVTMTVYLTTSDVIAFNNYITTSSNSTYRSSLTIVLLQRTA